MAKSDVLPTDPFELALEKLTGQPNGAHTNPVIVQARDFYGNVTQFIVQTVKHSEGNTVFVTQVNAAGSARFILPPEVIKTMQRQQDSVTMMVRKRHGTRLAERMVAEGRAPVITPEMRQKAALARKAKRKK